MKPTPLLFLSDNPTLPTGLGRITRDLATLASRLPQWRVGVMGRGGTGTRQLPFVLYPFDAVRQWGEDLIEGVWQDFAGAERGVVFTIWDASRLHWFARPEYMAADPRAASLVRFLQAGHFDRWGYFPIDSTGPGDRLTTQTQATLLGYDRILAYTEWAADLVRRSIGGAQATARRLDWIPHGLNTGTFRPRDRQGCREAFGQGYFHENDIVIGCVATNQARKDWGLAAQVGALLKQRYGKRLRLWWHIDTTDRAWSINALLADYGLAQATLLTTDQLTDAQMSTGYAACDATIHVGSEGFGYPIAESLASGVPAITGAYAGGAELVRDRPDWLVDPIAYRLETTYNCMRPVYDAYAWAACVERAIGGDHD